MKISVDNIEKTLKEKVYEGVFSIDNIPYSFTYNTETKQLSSRKKHFLTNTYKCTRNCKIRNFHFKTSSVNSIHQSTINGCLNINGSHHN